MSISRGMDKKKCKLPNLAHKGTRERKKQNPKSVEGKKVIKIRAEINEIGMRKIKEKINETKSCFFKKINKMTSL